MAEQGANALVVIGVLSGLLFLVYGPWQWVCTDWARQIAFEKRDQLFDMARAGELNFKSREYRAIRASLESSIRFAHDLSWPLLLSYLVARRRMVGEKSDLLDAVNRISDPDTRRKVSKAVNDAQRALLVMVIAKSPLAVLALPLVVLILAAVFFIDRCRRHAVAWANFFANVIQVEAEGLPQLQPQKSRSFWQLQ
ncbi:hypothetical protein V5279_21525 [Bradyrhizobium sp. 26S5]|uniref:hypothetical protein n=1 Tax=Bradyrhizobium sp. 26S5 TaxID=3139729 RepID=UPI0030D195C0